MPEPNKKERVILTNEERDRLIDKRFQQMLKNFVENRHVHASEQILFAVKIFKEGDLWGDLISSDDIFLIIRAEDAIGSCRFCKKLFNNFDILALAST